MSYGTEALAQLRAKFKHLLGSHKVVEGHADLCSEALEIMETSSKLWKVASKKALAPI